MLWLGDKNIQIAILLGDDGNSNDTFHL